MKMNNILAEPVSYIAFFFVLGLMPLALVMLTSFTKISIVLSLLRNALGVQQVPSNLVIAGLSLAATMVIMQPVAQQIMRTGEIEKMMRGRAPVSVTAIIEGASEPVRTFLRRHAKSEERDFFLKALQVQQKDESRQDDDFSVLVPAFVISEIGAAFEILMAMGMSMFSPTVVSIPLKLLVFVMAAGLPRLMHSLVLSYTP
jgi:type III secretion protein R